MDHLANPFRGWATIVDCGDISNSPFDKLQALSELEHGWKAIGARDPKNREKSENVRIISIGGDHTISMTPEIFSYLKINC
jgi:agmatinase